MSEEIKKEEVNQEQKQEVAVANTEHVNMVADLQGGLYSSSDTRKRVQHRSGYDGFRYQLPGLQRSLKCN